MRFTAALLTLGLLLIGKALALDEASVVVKAEATGSAATRDEAYLDACRQCITKIHGTRLAGRMTRAGGQFVKLTADGKLDNGFLTKSFSGQATLGTQGVSDDATAAFGGLITSVELLSEQEQGGRWLVRIKADVLGRVPDKFKGRESVVLPSVGKLAGKLAAGAGEGGGDLSQSVAERLIQAARDSFGLRREYVMLERDNEDALDAEISRAAPGGNAARVEEAKLQSEKVADSMLLFDLQPIRVRAAQENLRGLVIHRLSASLSANIKYVDLATRGEIASARLLLDDVSVSSERSAVDAAELLRRQFLAQLDRAMAQAFSHLFWEFSVFRARVDSSGTLSALDPVAAKVFEAVTRIELKSPVAPTAAADAASLTTALGCKGGKIDPAAAAKVAPTAADMISYRITGFGEAGVLAGSASPMAGSAAGAIGAAAAPKPANASVVFSDHVSLARAIAGSQEELKPLAERLARELQRSARSHIAGRKDLVVLDRENEALAEAELDRSVGSNTAAFERQKLGRERSGDYTLVFDFGPLEVGQSSLNFKFADSLRQVQASLVGVVKLIEVSTKIEKTTAALRIGPVAATSVQSAAGAGMEVEAALFKAIERAVGQAMSQVLWSLDKAVVSVGAEGTLEADNASLAAILPQVARAEVANLDEVNGGKKASQAREVILHAEAGRVRLENPAGLAGKKIALRITAFREEPAAAGALPKASTEKANSILDKFK